MLSVVSPIAEESHSRDYLIKKYVYSIHLFIFALLTYCNNGECKIFCVNRKKEIPSVE